MVDNRSPLASANTLRSVAHAAPGVWSRLEERSARFSLDSTQLPWAYAAGISLHGVKRHRRRILCSRLTVEEAKQLLLTQAGGSD